MKRFLLFLLATLLAAPLFAEVVSYDQPIHDAARSGSGDDVRRLLKADPKQRDLRNPLGSTPLHLAGPCGWRSGRRSRAVSTSNPTSRANPG